jgi:hypothetical protein
MQQLNRFIHLLGIEPAADSDLADPKICLRFSVEASFRIEILGFPYIVGASPDRGPYHVTIDFEFKMVESSLCQEALTFQDALMLSDEKSFLEQIRTALIDVGHQALQEYICTVSSTPEIYSQDERDMVGAFLRDAGRVISIPPIQP